MEGAKASAKLIGTISAVSPPSVPDSGSTLALMAMAVVGLGGLRQYLTCKASLESTAVYFISAAIYQLATVRIRRLLKWPCNQMQHRHAFLEQDLIMQILWFVLTNC